MSTDDPDRTVPRDPEPAPSLGDTQVKPAGERSGGSSPWVTIPGFEIERELKRGGMGVVYRATQTGLNRTVALKMILASGFADPSMRARFLLEAESVAALEHPHVVRVFAFGEHAGHPYLAMEFLPGGTLSDRLKSGPLPVRDATEYLVKLAGAVAHAHSRGIVHRDIKPANVLLTAEGEPRLADFGLAKVGRADQHLSVAGQPLGTPSYMAPEQAAGKTHEVGTAADVYALGAVLYDLLTGRPPFRGDTVAVTLQKVIAEEPERPRTLNAAIPDDLETICLKCLEKEPSKRYPTAQALADDLSCFLRDEPISARPAGALERGYKWVKRNKVVAGALTATSLALLVGAGFSLGFGLEAQKQAKNANDAAEREKGEAARADRERNDAVAARNEVERKNTALAEAQNRTNRALAKALLGPITADNRGRALTSYEVEAFWQIAELRRNEASWMFLEEATRTPLSCAQLECRAEYALHAAVGLDLVRRDEANQLLLARLRATNTSGNHSRNLALAATRTGFASSGTATAAAHPLSRALAGEANYGVRRDLATALAAVAERMEPSEGALTLTRALADEVATHGSDSIVIEQLARGLARVTGRMDREAAQKTCTEVAALINQARAKGHYQDINGDLAKSLRAVADRMDPVVAARIFLDAIATERSDNAYSGLGEGLAAAAARISDANEARSYCDKAADLLATSRAQSDTYRRLCLTYSLAAVAQGMDSNKELRVLAAALRNCNRVEREVLTTALVRVTRRMDPATAQKAHADVIADSLAALRNDTDSKDKDMHAQVLVAVAGWIEPNAARKACAHAADIFIAGLANKNPDALDAYWLSGFSAVVTQMDPREAVIRLRTVLVDPTRTSLARAHLAENLGVAGRMDPGAARVPCTEAALILLVHLREAKDGNELGLLADGLSAVAGCMDPAAARKLCAEAALILNASLPKEMRDYDRFRLARGLSSLAAWLPAPDAASMFLDALADQKYNGCGEQFARGLSAVVERMDPAVGAPLLTNVLAKNTEPSVRGEIAKGLAAVVRRMDENSAQRLCTEATHVLINALTNHEGSLDGRTSLARGLSAVASRTEPGTAAQVLLNALSVEKNYNAREDLVRGFAAVVCGLTPDERARARSTFILATGGFTGPHNLTPSIPLVYPRLQPQPRLLPPQALVELLKHPLCIGSVRQVVLDALASTYNRPFKDQWEFVEFVQKNNTHDHTTGKPIDLFTPPKRPEPRP